MRSYKPCESYEGCAGTGVLNDLEDSGSGREVYCDCVAGVDLYLADMADDVESIADRSERRAARYTREDGKER